MTSTVHHAQSSARIFGGRWEDYLHIHQWFDATKASYCDFRHRALRHHAEGIAECISLFGDGFENSDGKIVSVRYVAEQHVLEDCGARIPTLADWLSCIEPEPWMARATPSVRSLTRRGADHE